jgi:hypothetical protein
VEYIIFCLWNTLFLNIYEHHYKDKKMHMHAKLHGKFKKMHMHAKPNAKLHAEPNAAR